jgi:Ca2+-binding RTX toxin-like protein
MPIRKLSEFIVSTKNYNQGGSEILQLPGGGFATSWWTDEFESGSREFRVRLFDDGGKSQTPELRGTTTRLLGEYSQSSSSLSSGGFAVAMGSPETDSIQVAVFNNRAKAIEHVGIPVIDAIGVELTKLANGKFIVIWDDENDRNYTYQIHARLFNDSGKALTGTITIGSKTESNRLGDATALGDNRFLVIWSERNNWKSDWKSQVYDSTGKSFGKPILLNQEPNNPGFNGVTLETLKDGRALAVWYSGGPYDSLCYGTIFDTNGKVAQKEFKVIESGLGIVLDIDTAILADGRFVAAWTLRSGLATDLYLKVFNSDGTASGSSLQLTSTPDISEYEISVEALNNGTIAASWTTRKGLDEKVTISGTILDPTKFTGTSKADKWIGGSRADKISGGDGNDKLYGRSGHDKIAGGSGNDLLKGGFGQDTLSGGTGVDQFHYGSRKEGGDTITFFGEVDVLVFEGSAFKLKTYEGTLKSTNFESRTSGHKADDANDYFIFDQKTNQLWFDSNGSGSGGDTLIAQLNDIKLSSSDFVII